MTTPTPISNNSNNNNNERDALLGKQQQQQQQQQDARNGEDNNDVPVQENVSDNYNYYDDDRGFDSDNNNNNNFVPLKERAWSFRIDESSGKGGRHYVFCLIYAIVNVIIAVPSLFGYAAVIFNHPIFSNHMNALSKLLISSSLVHQLGFLLFSGLPFAIGTVQDAGLIFLSNMANTIADRMIEDGNTEVEILSTTLVLLCAGTASLGLVLVAMGKFKLADAVSFLPMPVVGGYLAYIGYFCVLAGTSLCISQPMMDPRDWALLFDGSSNLKLAVPGLATGLVLTLVGRLATNPGTLPLVMVAIPALFYAVFVGLCGISLDEARDSGWVGRSSPSVPVSELVHIVDFSKVRWDLVVAIIPTWFGMVFVVSFASCLDVAAIAIDMGQPLDTNKELATVGICNFMSGMTLGFTGSYIFSQTIFMYRTGVHDRCIGVMIMVVYSYIVVSPVNILEVAPLFFLGSTLIFIGYDLMFEWLWEVRHQVFLQEYCIVWFTFLSIHAVGIDFGILIGILIAICDQILTTAQSTGANRIEKRSRAVYTKADANLLHEKAYCSFDPKIVSLEIIGNLFFGSSLSTLNQIYEEIGLAGDNTDENDRRLRDDAAAAAAAEAIANGAASLTSSVRFLPGCCPGFVVLDLMGVTHLDASATRGCFLQLAKMAAKKHVVICASGLSPRIEWMFRSHEVAFETAEEEDIERAELMRHSSNSNHHNSNRPDLERILVFTTAAEALEFCETLFLRRANGDASSTSASSHHHRGVRGANNNNNNNYYRLLEAKSRAQSISTILSNFLGTTGPQTEVLQKLEDLRYHNELTYRAGQVVFAKRGNPDAFYIVLNGCVANNNNSGTSSTFQAARRKQQSVVVSGAGKVDHHQLLQRPGSADNIAATCLWQVGGVFGFNDFLLDKKRTFQTVATTDETKLAVFTRSGMDALSTQDPELYALMQRVLLRASTLDLANCTCHDV
eukprot:jgi/Psemu1/320162/estExt_fgenesh1_pm.C_4380002